MKLKPHQIAIFDRGYVDYQQYAKWTNDGVHFVTRLKDNAVYQGLQDLDISDSCPTGYIKDEKINISYTDEQKKEQVILLRRVVYYDVEKKKILQFLTNIFDMDTEQIGLLYKQR
ncbi:transposase, partial [Pedobacter jamesrossensis]